MDLFLPDFLVYHTLTLHSQISNWDSTIPLLGIYPKELRVYIHIKTWLQMFVAPLFIITKMWKQLKYPWTDGWINKIQYSHTATKKKKQAIDTIDAIEWMNLKNVGFNWKKVDTKVTYCMIPSIQNVYKRQIYGDRKSISSCPGLEAIRGLNGHLDGLKRPYCSVLEMGEFYNV